VAGNGAQILAVVCGRSGLRAWSPGGAGRPVVKQPAPGRSALPRGL
jgi:hypothetical protein